MLAEVAFGAHKNVKHNDSYADSRFILQPQTALSDYYHNGGRDLLNIGQLCIVPNFKHIYLFMKIASFGIRQI